MSYQRMDASITAAVEAGKGETGDKYAISIVWGDFRNRQTEADYQKSTWRENARQVRFALIAGTVAFVVAMTAEIVSQRGGIDILQALTVITVAHLGVACLCLFVFLATLSRNFNDRVSLGLVGFAAAYGMATFAVVDSGTVDWNDYAITIALSIVYLAVLVPNRVPHTIASICIILAGYLSAIPFQPGTEPNLRIIVTELMVAGLCLLIVRRSEIRSRNAYVRERRLRHMRDKAVSELGEAQFHREAFEQSAAENVTVMEELEFLREDMEQQAEFLRAILNNISQGVSVFDKDLRLANWNDRFIDLMELPEDRLAKGLPLRELVAFNVAKSSLKRIEQERVVADNMVEIAEKVLGKGERCSYERVRNDGVIFEVTIHPMPGGGVVNTYSDITERKRAEQLAQHMAEHDQLTGLANRVAFEAALKDIFQDHENSRRSSALALFDLDGFKPVNDSFGHPVGDQLLVEVAKVLRGAVRENDVAARIGGDEFAVVFRSIHKPDDAHIPIQRIIDTLGQPMNIDGNRVHIGVSVGLALCPDDGADPESLTKKADDALYAAKKAGKGRLSLAS